MKLYCYSNEAFLELRDRFLDSLHDRFEVVCADGPPAESGARAGGWENMIFKARFIADAIETNLGSTIVYSDVDVQCFRPIRPIVDRALEARSHPDIVFQREWPDRGVNTGFMAIRCSEGPLALWTQVAEDLAQRAANADELLDVLTDQHLINDLIDTRQAGISSTRFGPEVWAWSHGDLPAAVVLHHANCVRTVAGKLAQMDLVRRAITHGAEIE